MHLARLDRETIPGADREGFLPGDHGIIDSVSKTHSPSSGKDVVDFRALPVIVGTQLRTGTDFGTEQAEGILAGEPGDFDAHGRIQGLLS
jgi:hypothetical protein